MTEVLDETTGELTATLEPEPEPEPTPEPEPAPEPEGRCEAETTVGGTPYRCALQTGHPDEHAFQPITGETPPAEQPPGDQRDVTEALEAEAVRHAARIAEIFGAEIEPAKGRKPSPERLQAIFAGLEAAGLHACELCAPNFGGWRPDVAPPEAVIAKVRVVLGMPDLTNYAPSATERQCDDCRGLGKVRTGSSVSLYETATCDACAGKGYVPSRPRLNVVPPEPEAESAGNGAPSFPDDGIKRDMFGTPETDPDYGKMPNMRQRPVDYWRTAHG